MSPWNKSYDMVAVLILQISAKLSILLDTLLRGLFALDLS